MMRPAAAGERVHVGGDDRRARRKSILHAVGAREPGQLLVDLDQRHPFRRAAREQRKSGGADPGAEIDRVL